MKIDRLRKIIAYSDANREMMASKVSNFYSAEGMSSDKEVLNIMQIARSFFYKKRYLVLEIPLADKEIGALCYKGDGMGYIILNSSLPKVNVNFAVCHELYHVFCQENIFRSKVEFANGDYEQEEEFAANLFAGMFMMPEASFRIMYNKFEKESAGDKRETIIRLMNYYQAPYMAVLIRCFELGLPNTESVSTELLDTDKDTIKEKFLELWLDYSILEATKKDDFVYFEDVVKRFGDEYIRDSYLNERTLNKALQNIRKLCSEIKGE